MVKMAIEIVSSFTVQIFRESCDYQGTLTILTAVLYRESVMRNS